MMAGLVPAIFVSGSYTAGHDLYVSFRDESAAPGARERTMFIRLGIVIGVMCFAGAAHAQNMWSMTAGACTPDHATVRADRHSVSFAGVQHASGNVDPIILHCPVARFTSGNNAWKLKLTYRDTTGAD